MNSYQYGNPKALMFEFTPVENSPFPPERLYGMGKLWLCKELYKTPLWQPDIPWTWGDLPQSINHIKGTIFNSSLTYKIEDIINKEDEETTRILDRHDLATKMSGVFLPSIIIQTFYEESHIFVSNIFSFGETKKVTCSSVAMIHSINNIVDGLIILKENRLQR